MEYNMTIGVFIIVSLILLLRLANNVIKNASLQYEDESGFYEMDSYSILWSDKDKKIAA